MNDQIDQGCIRVKSLWTDPIHGLNDSFDFVVLYTDNKRDFTLRYPSLREKLASVDAFLDFFNTSVLSDINNIRSILSFITTLMQNSLVHICMEIDSQVKIVVDKSTTKTKRRSKRKTFNFSKTQLVESLDSVSQNPQIEASIAKIYKICGISKKRLSLINHKQPVSQPASQPVSNRHRFQVASKRCI